MIDLTDVQKAILAQTGHLLVTGGPGSGKTTIAILKAAKIAESALRPGQSILFLSFARATVARILDAMNEEKALSSETRQRIDIDTYHAFFWRILRTHGYLLGLPRRLEIITPPNEAIALSAIRRDYPSQNKQSELQKQEKKDGRRQNANVSLRTMAECVLASSLIMLASYCTVRTRCDAS